MIEMSAFSLGALCFFLGLTTAWAISFLLRELC